jgi:hypothetical protein
MPTKYSSLLLNAFVSEKGTVKKVPGYAKVNSGGAAGVRLTSGCEFVQTNGTRSKIVAGGGSIFKATGTTLTAIKTGLDNGVRVNFSTMKDLCVMTNGVAAPMKNDGSAVSSLGGSWPATTFKTHAHKGRLWGIELNNRMLATHSALDNPEDTTTNNDAGYIDFKYVLPKGDVLVDMATYVNLMVFIFRHHIAIYSGQTPSGTGSDFQLVQLIETGAVDTGVTLGVGTDMAFLHDAGVKSLKQVVTTGALNVGDVSQLIDPVLRAQIKANPGGYYSVAHVPRFGWMLFLVGDTIWIYSYQRKAWARFYGADAHALFTTLDGDLYLCGTDYLYLLDETLGTWDGADITMKWQTPWVTMFKDCRFCYPKVGEIGVIAPTKPVTFSVEAWTEGYVQSVSTVAGTLLDDVADFDSLSPVDADVHDHLRFPMFGRGRHMLMEFTNTSDIPGLEIASLGLQFVPGGF